MERQWSKEIEEKFKEQAIQIKERSKTLVIDTPPPYPAPFWHIGAAMSYVLQDIIARIFKMFNYNVIFPVGFDRNGIPVEWYVEKYEGITLNDLPREKFIEVCKNNLDKYVERMKKIMKRFLLSCDFENFYLTDSEEYRAFVQKTFKEVFDKGLVYEDIKPSAFCPHCKTTIALSEIEREEIEGKLYYIKFLIKNSDEKITIATTRPELLEACRLIIFNPKDKRYKHLENKEAIVPLFNFSVPIKKRKEADINFGSGIVMICSYGDFDDVKILADEKIEPKVIFDENGLCGGKTSIELREEIVTKLKELNLIEKEEKILQNIPLHDKCKTRIEIIPMKEFFLKQVEFKEDMLKIAKSLRIFPRIYKKRLLDWIKSLSMDWPISRRRYYATEIPIWYCKKCNYIYIPEDGKYHKPWLEKLEINCPSCNSTEWIGEQRTFDTWFDSSVSLLFITKNINEKFLSIRPQGYEIIRTWLYYSLLRVFQLTNKPAFDIVLIHGMGLDEFGRKMSKSLGNVIMPEEIIEEYGVEPARFWFAMEYSIGSDYKISKEKIAGSRKFLTKLINIASFIKQFEYCECNNLEATDKWIISETVSLKDFVLRNYKKFKINIALQKIHSFVFDVFSSNYIEMVKRRVFEKNESAIYALYFCFKEILKLLYPVIPATASYLFKELYGEEIKSFGRVNKKLIDKNLLGLTKDLLEFNSYVWKIKKEKNLSLKSPINVEIPEKLRIFEKDLINMHKITMAHTS
ncbi:MAG: valine--tRNA ligase [Candidatus Aenigmarchaeota archaeon]|nr:valine--tRNA ligase [Candidatus Aenigmarchaeota archaeon]MDW8149759.1 valine--tRNA ligase [Candidatus Aenigmarchaeota archaeon]